MSNHPYKTHRVLPDEDALAIRTSWKHVFFTHKDMPMFLASIAIVCAVILRISGALANFHPMAIFAVGVICFFFGSWILRKDDLQPVQSAEYFKELTTLASVHPEIHQWLAIAFTHNHTLRLRDLNAARAFDRDRIVHNAPRLTQEAKAALKSLREQVS